VSTSKTRLSEEEYVQCYEELQALVRAWKDRLDIHEYAASCLFLQVGATMAAWSGSPLAHTLSTVEHAWKTADETPEETS